MSDLLIRRLEREVAAGDPNAFGRLQAERIRTGDLGYPVWAPTRHGRTLTHLWEPSTLDGFSTRGIEGMDWGGQPVCSDKLLKLFLHDLTAFATRETGDWQTRYYDWKLWSNCGKCNKALINAVPVLRDARVLLAASQLE
jgi:hypothetical protein